MSRMFRSARVAGGLLAAVALAGCGSSGSGRPAARPTAPAPTTTAPSPTPSPTARKLTAAEVTEQLQAAGLPIGQILVYTAATDPNHLLGRPGGYVGKTAWVDHRIPADRALDDTPGSIQLGGSVEVFADERAAVERAAYVQGFGAGGLGSEYDYSAGPVVLRVSGVLTPDQAAGYSTALAAIEGVPAAAATR